MRMLSLLALGFFALLAACDATISEEVVGQSAVEPETALPVPDIDDLGPGETVTVVHITDGDTVVIMRGGQPDRLRLIGIDTPETAQSPRGEEPFANEATEALRLLLRNTEVTLRLDVGERDRFGRLLGYIHSSDGTFVNAEMVRRGWARPVTVPPNVHFADEFARLAQEAREAGRGIWQPAL
ncbi:MAG: micrococcal nuclease [Polyangiales bacterium]|jgi:micrococcal nuclease